MIWTIFSSANGSAACSYFAHGLLCKYHGTCCCAMCCYMFMSICAAGSSGSILALTLLFLPAAVLIVYAACRSRR